MEEWMEKNEGDLSRKGIVDGIQGMKEGNGMVDRKETGNSGTRLYLLR